MPGKEIIMKDYIVRNRDGNFLDSVQAKSCDAARFDVAQKLGVPVDSLVAMRHSGPRFQFSKGEIFVGIYENVLLNNELTLDLAYRPNEGGGVQHLYLGAISENGQLVQFFNEDVAECVGTISREHFVSILGNENDNDELSCRLLIEGDGDSSVEELLDEAGYDYDYDGYDRLMVSPSELDEVVELLEGAGYDVEEV